LRSQKSDGPRHQPIIKELEDIGKCRYLDLGCWAGTLSNYFADIGYEVVGVDVENTHFSKCKFETVQCDLNLRIPFKSKSFDYIVASDTLEHIENANFVIDEMKRVAKKGILISVPNRQFFVFKLRKDLEVGPINHMEHGKHYHHWSIKEFQNFVKNHKLKIIKACYTIDFSQVAFLQPVVKFFPRLFAQTQIYHLSVK